MEKLLFRPFYMWRLYIMVMKWLKKISDEIADICVSYLKNGFFIGDKKYIFRKDRFITCWSVFVRPTDGWFVCNKTINGFDFWQNSAGKMPLVFPCTIPAPPYIRCHGLLRLPEIIHDTVCMLRWSVQTFSMEHSHLAFHERIGWVFHSFSLPAVWNILLKKSLPDSGSRILQPALICRLAHDIYERLYGK